MTKRLQETTTLTDEEKHMGQRNAARQRKCKDENESEFGLARAGMYGAWAQAHPRAYVNQMHREMKRRAELPTTYVTDAEGHVWLTVKK